MLQTSSDSDAPDVDSAETKGGPESSQNDNEPTLDTPQDETGRKLESPQDEIEIAADILS